MTSILPSSVTGLSDLFGRTAIKNKKTQESHLPPIGAAAEVSGNGSQKVMAVTDYLKTEKDQALLLDRSVSAKTEVNAQLAAQGNVSEMKKGELSESDGLKPKTAAEEFLEFARLSPAEKMRALILGEMGITEEDLAAMSPDERAKIEEKIAARLKERMKQEMEKQASEGPEASAIEITV